MPEINDLPPTPGAINSDLLATKKGATDYRASIGQLAEAVLNNLTPEQAMALVQQVATNNSGLNANFLQGATRAFLQNAGNLNAGTVPTSRLPAAGVLFTASNTGGNVWVAHINIPEYILGGARVRLAMGQTEYQNVNTTASITYPVPFISGVSNASPTHRPLVIASTIGLGGWAADARPSVFNSTHSGFRVRALGSSSNMAFCWLAIGRY